MHSINRCDCVPTLVKAAHLLLAPNSWTTTTQWKPGQWAPAVPVDQYNQTKSEPLSFMVFIQSNTWESAQYFTVGNNVNRFVFPHLLCGNKYYAATKMFKLYIFLRWDEKFPLQPRTVFSSSSNGMAIPLYFLLLLLSCFAFLFNFNNETWQIKPSTFSLKFSLR